MKKKVTVAGKSKCLIIAPDGYSGGIADTYSAEQWTAAESQGLVCLPAAGCRKGSSVEDVGNYGSYWSSSPDGNSNALRLYFDASSVNPDSYGGRGRGYPVRLVYSVQ